MFLVLSSHIANGRVEDPDKELDTLASGDLERQPAGGLVESSVDQGRGQGSVGYPHSSSDQRSNLQQPAAATVDVDRPTEVDKDGDALLRTELDDDRKKARKAVTRLVGFVVFCLTFFSMLFAKLSFVSLAHDIKRQTNHSHGNHSNNETTNCRKSKAYWNMYWVIIVPYVFCWLRCVWQSHVFDFLGLDGVARLVR